ncbi:endonuclease [Metabacillus indicus]|uniref:endonuclease n=1 Tax=Metabacillus indicus TaxID=246786 RepID=UPI002A045C97|nr:endonuclease [Metabacillus indicus]MDX8288945.1 endonuclease [Metabacillus indicus]
MLTGKLLGDGNLSIEKGKRPRFRFSHSSSDSGWCFHCYETLKAHIPLSMPKYRRISDNRIRAGYTDQFYVQSKLSPLFDSLLPLWYKERTKSIPFRLLERVINPLTLAWWYQDDGHLKIQNNTPKKIILSTDSFTQKENRFLTELLYTQFNLHFKLDGQNRLVIYDQKQILLFLRIVHPYIHHSMKRKLLSPPEAELTFPDNKRTSIHIPIQILIRNPTQEIRDVIDKSMNLNPLSLYESYFSLSNTNEIKKRKSYQIVLTRKHQEFLDLIKRETGMNMSEAVSTMLNLNAHLNRKRL